MKPWFTIEQLDEDSYIISEYRHWEETHCYLLNGTRRSLLIDTGLGIGNIQGEIRNLTDKPVTAVATHVHWDHIGGHWYFPRFYAHQAELPWLTGQFPQPLEAVRQFVTHRCDLPEGYDVSAYRLFQGTPEKVLAGGEILDLGGRRVAVLHTPGHSPAICASGKNPGATCSPATWSTKAPWPPGSPPPIRKPTSIPWRLWRPCRFGGCCPATTPWISSRRSSSGCRMPSGSAKPRELCATEAAHMTTAIGPCSYKQPVYAHRKRQNSGSVAKCQFCNRPALPILIIAAAFPAFACYRLAGQ